MEGIDTHELALAVERMHACRAALVTAMPVREEFEGRPVWQGIVHVFDLANHATATRAYAWSSPIEGSDKRRIFAVLRVPPIESAHDAVRAAIVAEHRQEKSRGG